MLSIRIVVILTALSQGASSLCCIECDTIDSALNICTACNPGFYLVSNICLNDCPSFYSSSGTGECLPDSSTPLISANFNEFLNTNVFGGFLHNNGTDFFSEGSLNPTLDRGFYCSSSKSLISSSAFKFAPQLSFNFTIPGTKY